MPSRNIVKIDVADNYYHVYNRGISRMTIFHDDADLAFFLSLLKRYLSEEQAVDQSGRVYHSYRGDVELLAFCLMTNHFHLLFYQHDEQSIASLMKAAMTSYSRYYNQKYVRSGPLFESRYKSSMITSDQYLMHISRYIHMNPEEWRHYRWSSLPYYVDGWHADWLQPGRILELFDGAAEYGEFVSDYTAAKKMMKAIKRDLANF